MIANMRYGLAPAVGARSDWLAAGVVFVIVIAAAYEAAVALQWLSVGQLPGEGGRYEGIFLAAGGLAMLTGFVVSLFLAVANRRTTPGVLLGASAVALVAAHAYTFDTYDLPTLIRYTESGTPSASWVAWVVGAGLLASLFCLVQPRIGFVLTACVSPVCLFTYVFTGCCN
jgi:hypothetical protein